MPACTFFGHKYCPDSVIPHLQEALLSLVENGLVDTFYVGNQGQYDVYVLSVLRKIKETYPNIKYSVILAYHPSVRPFQFARPEETEFPEEVAGCHPRFAIEKRNRWMLSRSDYVISYANHPGGSMKFTELAIKNKKTVINLAEKI